MNTETEDEVELYSAKLKIKAERDDSRRNTFRVKVECDPLNEELGTHVVCLDLSAGWGHPDVWSEFTAAEARTLALYLTTAAREVDRLEGEEES